MKLHNLLNRIFGTAEEINGAQRCPTYLYRWTLLSIKGKWAIYLHHFVGDDWSNDLHDHPKRFITIGLWGWYLETTPAGLIQHHPETKIRKWHAPWVRTFPANHIHRISVPSKNCWTLVVVLKPVREWGFWHLGKFIPWKKYVASDTADKMKACE